MSTQHYDIIDSSDFRLPGGTSHSLALEIKVQSEAGLRTGLLQIDSDLQRRAHVWSKPILAAIRGGQAVPIPRTAAVSTSLLVIRHPSVIRSDLLPSNVSPDRVVVVANHAPRDADGSSNYDVEAADAALRARYGVTPTWFPIGPVVREDLAEHSETIDVSECDWTNIMLTSDVNWPVRTTPAERPVIGRHSRGQAGKWPERAATIRAAYPLDKEFDVRILGGVEPVRDILGKVPSNWTVYEFDGQPVSEFLRGIDFWVYFHHSHTREAFGRAICEAMAAGSVVVLPEYLRSTYGDAAVYCAPEEVRDTVRALASNPEAFADQSARGQAFVRQLGPQLHEDRMRMLGVLPASVGKSSSASRNLAPRRRRVLFITSNGAGMGHLTRLLAIARHGGEQIEPVFLSLSTAVPVVQNYNIPFEYVASSGAMGVGWKAWNAYFAKRLALTLDDYRPDAVVFDGTMPYGGLTDALSAVPLTRIWVRRGMWKATSSGASLERERHFDLVIEPGEYSGDADRGPTKGRQPAVQVGPITLLDDRDILSRADARGELGLATDERVAIVTLGAGNINSIADAQQAAIDEFRAAGWTCFVTKTPIDRGSAAAHASDVRLIETYPLARFSRAFDVAVSACGYNSFHEWLAVGTPSVWVPNEKTSVDDQVARARWAEEAGLGLMAHEGDPGTIAAAVRELIRSDVRVPMAARLAALPQPTGASEAAATIVRVLTDWEADL